MVKMMNVNQFRDGETIRQNRNLTPIQKKTNAYTKEGVISKILKTKLK